MKYLIAVLLLLVFGIAPLFAVTEKNVSDALSNIVPHPRIILTDTRFQGLKSAAVTDTVLAGYVKFALKEADRFVKSGPIVYHIPDSKRLLQVSRQAKREISGLAFAYRWTGKRDYLDKAVAQMDAVCAFKDWNPSHFLDVGEMATAVAIGYDWLYRDLTDVQKKRYVDALAKFALKQKTNWWLNTDNNWNSVCNGGLTIAALVTYESDPRLATKVIARSVNGMPHAIRNYAPDGLWFEGIGYWDYMTNYTVMAITALNSAVDTDFGLSDIPGFEKTADLPIHTAAPSFSPFNFGDVGGASPNTLKSPRPLLAWQNFWLARRFNHPAWAAHEHRNIALRYPMLQHILFYYPPVRAEALPLAKRFGGPTEIAVFRTAWNDPNAAWLGVKAGEIDVNHSHMDAGSFEYECDGIRWALELGSDNYNMPGYFNRKAKLPNRWIYYRLNSASHNVMEFDSKRQDPAGSATITDFSAEQKSVTLDMRKAYKCDTLQSYTRKFTLDGKKLIIDDQFTTTAPTHYRWGITTDAIVAIPEDGSCAILSRNGKKHLVQIISPKNVRFTSESCFRPPPENPNKGYSRLVIDATSAPGPTRLQVTFTPFEN